jgi:hypothetical protein
MAVSVPAVGDEQVGVDRVAAGRSCRIVLALWASLVLLAAGTSLARNAGNAVITTKVFVAVTAPLAGCVCFAVRCWSRRVMAVALVGLAFLYLAATSAFFYTVAQCPVSPGTSRVCNSALSDD